MYNGLVGDMTRLYFKKLCLSFALDWKPLELKYHPGKVAQEMNSG